MRLTAAIVVLVIAMLIGNVLLIVAAVIGAAALAISGAPEWARFRIWLHTPTAGHAAVRALPPDDDPDFLRWVTEQNHRQQHGDDSAP